MEKIKKCFLIIVFAILIFFVCFFIRPVVTEANAGDNFINQVQSNSNSFMNMGSNKLNSMNVTIDFDLIGGIAQVLYVALCIVLIAFTIYKAVKYGLSSASDKAAAKKELAGWIILCVLGIGVYPLFRLIVSAFDSSSYTANVVNQFGNTANGLTSASQNSVFMLILNTILRVIQVFGIGYIIIRFTVVGIKYFTASAVGRAEVKNGELQKTLILAVIIFGATGFFDIIYNAING